MTPVRRVVRAVVPVLVALALAWLQPSLGGRVAEKGTGVYSIAPQGWDRLVRGESPVPGARFVLRGIRIVHVSHCVNG